MSFYVSPRSYLYYLYTYTYPYILLYIYNYYYYYYNYYTTTAIILSQLKSVYARVALKTINICAPVNRSTIIIQLSITVIASQ